MEHDSMTSGTPSGGPRGMQVAGGGYSFYGNTFGMESFLPHPAYTVAQDALVMTDEQLETLRRQISVYATICHQLVEMHKASILQPPRFSGIQHMPYDPLTGLHKTTSRQRWTPTQTQLQILERLFEQGHGTPSKQRIKEITAELSRHGPIAETNVYNWFQNRKARAKRKQASISQKDGDSEADTDGDSPADKRRKHSRDNSDEQENCAQKSAGCSERSNTAARPPRERSLSSLFRDTTICKGSSVQAEASGRSWPASLGVENTGRLPLQSRFSNGSFGVSSSYQNGCLNYGGISLDASARSQIFNDVHS